MVAGLAQSSLRRAAVLGGGLICATVLPVSEARTQASTAQPAGTQVPSGPAVGTVNLGDRGWSESYRATPAVAADQFSFGVRGGVASDYVYRGTTLSDRRPAAGAGIEATFGQFYAGATAATVRLPTEPSAELTVSGGVRPKIGNVDLSLGATYYRYPGEQLQGPTGGIDYWEAGIRGDTTIGEQIRVAAGYAWSPNVSNTGAWSQYAAAGLGYDVPARLLPQDVSVSFTGGAGYSWFGHQSLVLGGFPLPDYLNWSVGMTITRKVFNLDLRYHDTNLTKESCYVFTGDPHAAPGGRVDPITNPGGLMSRWCSPAFVARFWLSLN
jgi:uncharacterized protein (TIGR02001 family)